MSSLSSPVKAIFSSKSALTRKGRNGSRVLLIRAINHHHHHNSINTSTPLHTSGSSSKNSLKVYENLSEGIVCYKDENGEIICEGYDEGPRFDCHQQVSRFSCNSRDAEMIGLLERSWLKVEERKEQLMGEKMYGCETL